MDGSVAALSHCIMGKTNWYIYSVFNKHFLSASFWRLCVIVSNSKDSLDLLPSPRRPSLLPDFSIPLLTSLMLWSSVLVAKERSWHLNQSIYRKADREVGQPYLEGPGASQKRPFLNQV